MPHNGWWYDQFGGAVLEFIPRKKASCVPTRLSNPFWPNWLHPLLANDYIFGV